MMPIDIDRPGTWPPRIHEAVSALAKKCVGKTRYTNDLPLSLEIEAPFRQGLSGYLLRAYHYTRLLPHERLMIQGQGLRMLSAALLQERIEAAAAEKAISTDEANRFLGAHVFTAGEEEHREGQVCLVLSQMLFQQIGVPTRVTALVALEDATKHKTYPSLHKLFVASLLGFNDLGADVIYRSSIPPEHIEAIDEVENIGQYC
jgi:hypothetical protein